MKSFRLFSWFNRRSYSQKFIVIGLLFAVALTGFYPMARDQFVQRENYGIKELEGTLYLRPLQALLTDLNTHHHLAIEAINEPGTAEELATQQAIIADDLAELAELDEKYRQSLQLDIELETIQQAWQLVLEAAEKQNPYEIDTRHFQINKEIRRAITRVGNTSFLILDPDLDTSYMRDTVLEEMPKLQDLLSQMSLIVFTANMQGEIPAGEKLELITLSSKITTAVVELRDNAKISWNNDETGQIEQITAMPLNDLDATVNAFLIAVNNQIVSPDQINVTPDLLESAEAAQAAMTTYYAAASEALEWGLNGRIEELTDRLIFAVAFAVAISSTALVIGFILMRTISRPLSQLAIAAGRLGAGEQDVHVPVTGEDEVSRAGRAFNTMASKLTAAQKKQESQLGQLTQLTKALETGAVVSQRLSTILDKSQLTEAVVTEVQRAFGYYHVHIYLYDPAKENLVIAGGTGEAGATMLSTGHKLTMGQGLVGKAAVTNAPVFVSDVAQEPNWLPNPLLPDTKAEVAIPIALRDRVIGVLDVQHNVADELNEESVELLQSIANQVAIALENADLFAERRRTNEEMSRFKLALERSPNAIFMTDVEGTILYVNSGFEKIYGYTAVEAVGQTPRILKSGVIPPEQYTHLWQTLLAKEPVVDEIVNKTKDGRLINIDASNNPIVNDEGELVGFLSLHNDITERKKAEALLAKQANELATVAQVGTAAATILEPEPLLQEVVDLTKSSFDLYHAHIHLLNDNQDTLVLTAGAGEIGQKMVAEGRRIPLAAEGSLVATVARTGQGAIRNYDPPGEGFMPHPLLAETSCEMAVPIALGDDVLGVLDVRADELNYFSEADMQTYTTLAAQIAVALQNARSFARSEKALKELSELSRRLTREGWGSYLDTINADLQLAYDLRQVSKVDGNGDNGNAGVTDSTLIQPLTVAGEPIGHISVADPHTLTDEAAEIIDAVAERLGAHVENLRLSAQTEQALAETAEQARRRAILNEISEQLSRAESLDDIFQTVAEGTARILPSDRVTLAILTEDGDHFSVMSLAGTDKDVLVHVNQPLAGSFIEKAIQSGNILITHDAEPNPQTGIRASMIVPLITGSGTMGTLNVASKTANVYDEADQGLMLQIGSILSSVIENKRLLTETQQRAEEMALINRVVSAVARSLDLEQSLQVVADELAQAIGVGAIGIALMNDDRASLTMVAEHYDPEKAGSSRGYVIPIEGNTLTQEVLRTRQTVVVEDAQNHPLTEPVHEGMRQRGVNTLYVIPMFTGNEIVGTVGIDILEKDRLLSPRQVRLAETIVFQVATAVQNARLFTQSQERAAELALINAVSELASSRLELSSLFDSVGELLQDTFSAESLYFALYDKDTQKITFPYFQSREEGGHEVAPRPLADGGLTGQIIESQKSLLRLWEPEKATDEARAEGAQFVGSGRATDSYLGVPMIVGNEIVGVIALSSYHEVRTYSEQDQLLLETLADTVGVAIQNIRQFQAAQRRAEREALINRISQKIQSAPTVQSALQTAVSELGQALKLKKAVVELTAAQSGNGHTHE